MSGTSYLVRRLMAALLVLLLVAALTFMVFHLLPTDVSQASCGKPCTTARRAAVRHFYGYDQPTIVQLAAYLKGIVTGRTYGSGAAALLPTSTPIVTASTVADSPTRIEVRAP